MEKNNQKITEELILANMAAALEGFEPDPDVEAAYDEMEEDYVTEDDIARENRFWVDDDGHWQELDDDD